MFCLTIIFSESNGQPNISKKSYAGSLTNITPRFNMPPVAYWTGQRLACLLWLPCEGGISIKVVASSLIQAVSLLPLRRPIWQQSSLHSLFTGPRQSIA
jgi:hypothetical protein